MKKNIAKIIILPVFLLSFLFPFFANSSGIAFDNASTGNATATSLTFSKTNTGSNLILWVGITINAPANIDYVSGVTYNGVSMTRGVALIGNGLNQDSTYLYYLVAPATGAHNVVVSIIASQQIYAVASSYTGVNQAAQTYPTASKYEQTSGLSTQTISVATSSSWVISTCGDGQNGSPTRGTGLNATRSSQTFEAVTADSNGTVSTGSNTIGWNAGGANSDLNYVITAFDPAITSAVNITQLFHVIWLWF